MLFWRDKKSCWEFMECERGPGGSKADALGLCPVALKKSSSLIIPIDNADQSGDASPSDTESNIGIGKKRLECLQCDFFQTILREAGIPREFRKPGPANTNTLIRKRMPILAILSQCYQGNVPFNTLFDQDSAPFQSTLTNIDPETNVLTFNTTEMAPGQLCRSDRLHISGQIHGTEVRFTTTLFGAGENDSAAFFMVKLPHFIYHPKLRQSTRIRIKGKQQQLQAYSTNSNQQITGKIIDLSIDGIGIEVQQKTSVIQGEILKDCSFVLPNGHGVPTTIEVRDIYYNPKHGTTRLGGKFHDIAKTHERHLIQFINNAQQSAARKLN